MKLFNEGLLNGRQDHILTMTHTHQPCCVFTIYCINLYHISNAEQDKETALSGPF